MAGDSGARGGRAWPFFLTAVLFGAVLCCCWLLWQRQAALEEAAAAELARLEALTAERDSLKEALLLSPCEAEKRLRAAAPEAPGDSAAKKQEEPASASLEKQARAGSRIEDVERACVFLISAAGPKRLNTGSGFFVAPGHIVTNLHVVNNARGRILVTSRALGKPALARIVAKSPGKSRDYALLKVDMPNGAAVAMLKFASDVRRTQKVGAWGFPDLVGKNDPGYAKLLRGEDFSAVPELSYSEGVVSAVLERDPRIIVHTAPISPGNSGGPLVNEAGEVVGINTMISLDEDSYRQASLALAGTDLRRFLAEHGINAVVE